MYVLEIKIAAHRWTSRLRRMLRLAINSFPFARRMLNLPEHRVRSLKQQIVQHHSKLDWWQRCWGPYYQVVSPSKVELGFHPPQCVLSEQQSVSKGVGQYQVFGEVFLAGIPGGRVIGPNGVVITPDGGVVEESAWCDGWIETDRSLTAFRLPEPEKLPGHYFFLGGNLIRGYAHWVFDALPRLLMIDMVERDDMKLVVFGKLNRWQDESLRLAGYHHLQRIELGNRYIQCEYLHFPSAVGKPGNTSPLALNFLRQRFLFGSNGGKHRLYITRRLSGRRHIVNESELEPLLKSHGFEIVETENLTFQQQVALFAEAEVVAGPHGAGLSNLAFAPSNCRVLEFFAPTCLRWMYYYLAAARGQKYWYLVADKAISAGKQHQDTGFDNLLIEYNHFAQALAAVTAGGTGSSQRLKSTGEEMML
jgi:capsular polysaccharide biosynthesis protein